LEKKALDSGVLDKDARNWLKANQNGIRNNVDVWQKAMKALEGRGVA